MAGHRNENATKWAAAVVLLPIELQHSECDDVSQMKCELIFFSSIFRSFYTLDICKGIVEV